MTGERADLAQRSRLQGRRRDDQDSLQEISGRQGKEKAEFRDMTEGETVEFAVEKS